ncbi:hypothetical protein BAMA_12950 [Bacillus manliponensis]|uniref:Uncharacterized protein n=1 Tax=Bacillus manliponensis TaxID=574376 RepID=A0A073JTB1_9BACI|nr:hypothetical protein BAMA_12950 [Bacillus manliponensis]
MGTMRKVSMQAMMLVVMLMMSMMLSKEVGAEREESVDWLESVYVTPSEISFGNEIKVKVTVKIHDNTIYSGGIKYGERIGVRYLLPYLDEDEEEVYQYVSAKYNPETNLFEGVLNVPFDFEQVGDWEIDTMHTGITGLTAYNSDLYEPRVGSQRESMEDFSGGIITLLEPVAGWNYIKEYGETQGHWYYFDEETLEFVTGWLEENEQLYYLNEDGMMVTGWAFLDGHWYYLNENGTMATGWKSINGKWYYLNIDGAMVTDWVSVNGSWYYLNVDGTMATSWVSVNGNWYYLNADGSMATGWVSVNGSWYYLNADGSMVIDWKQVNGKWYYLDKQSGAMATSRWIDKKYWVDANGVWTKTR